MEYNLSETFELWSTRPEQTIEAAKARAGKTKPAAKAQKDHVAGADEAVQDVSDAGEPLLDPEATMRMMKSLHIAQAFIDRFEAVGDALDSKSNAGAGAGVTQAFQTEQAKRMQQKVSEVDQEGFKPVTKQENGATDTAATASASANPAAASSSKPTSSVDDADKDWLPPLSLLSTMTGDSERGLRFLTPLPARVIRGPDDGPLLLCDSTVTVNNGGEGAGELLVGTGNTASSSAGEKAYQAEKLNGAFEFAVKMLRRWGGPRFHQLTPQQLNGKPKANWSIKDILD